MKDNRQIAASFYYIGNIVKNLQRRYNGITRKSTAESPIAEGDFLFAGQVWHRQQKIRPLDSSIHSIFYYEGNIVLNLQGRYDEITRKSTSGYSIAEGDFLIFAICFLFAIDSFLFCFFHFCVKMNM